MHIFHFLRIEVGEIKLREFLTKEEHRTHRSYFRCIEIFQSLYFLQICEFAEPAISGFRKKVFERIIKDSGSNVRFRCTIRSRPSRKNNIIILLRLLNSPHCPRARGFLIIIVKR